MKTAKINWTKIMANAGLVFFSTLGATSFAGSVNALQISAVNAFIMAGVAFFTEMKLECDNGIIGKAQKIAMSAVLL